MKLKVLLLAIAGVLVFNGALAQQIVTRKTALVALTEDPELRAEFETGLAVKARENSYEVVPSFDLVDEVDDVDSRRFRRQMIDEGVGAVLMMSPVAVGPGSSLASVRDSVSGNIYRDMRRFARQVSPSGGGEVFAVVHLAIYLIDEDGSELLSAGAVWLEEEPETTEESIELLQDLVIDNVNAVRAPIREHLGMPPLE